MVLHLPKIEEAVSVWLDVWFSVWTGLWTDMLAVFGRQLDLRLLPGLFIRAGSNPINFAYLWLQGWVVGFAGAWDNFVEGSLVAPLKTAAKLVVASLEATETKQRVLTAQALEEVIIECLGEMAERAVTSDLPIEARMAHYIRSKAGWIAVLNGVLRKLQIRPAAAAVIVKLIELTVLRLIRLTVIFSVGIGMIVFAFVLRDKLKPGDPGNLISKRLLSNQNRRATEAVVIRRRIGGVKP